MAAPDERVEHAFALVVGVGGALFSVFVIVRIVVALSSELEANA